MTGFYALFASAVGTGGWLDASMAVNLLGWSFTLGMTFGYIRTSLNNLDSRLERVERWIDDH